MREEGTRLIHPLQQSTHYNRDTYLSSTILYSKHTQYQTELDYQSSLLAQATLVRVLVLFLGFLIGHSNYVIQLSVCQL